MFGKIDYESHPEAKEAMTRFIEENLQRIIGDETTQDWVELVQYYSSSKCTSSKEDIEKELQEDIFPVN